MTTVTGVFDSRAEANRAVSDLITAGFAQSDISLIVSDQARSTIFGSAASDGSARAAAQDNVSTSTVDAERGGMAGASVGGALGAIAAGLTAAGLLVIPGVNLLVAGPIVAALAGGGAGAAIGGIAGGLIGAGFSDTEASEYEREIAAGKAVIAVHTTEERAPAARTALRGAGATTRAA